MLRVLRHALPAFGIMGAAVLCAASASANQAWVDDLSPIGAEDWNYERAAHLIERAGFGGTPVEIAALAAMTPEDAVRFLVNYDAIDNSHLPAYDPSDIHDPGLINFPPSRPATTQLAIGASVGPQESDGGR